MSMDCMQSAAARCRGHVLAGDSAGSSWSYGLVVRSSQHNGCGSMWRLFKNDRVRLHEIHRCCSSLWIPRRQSRVCYTMLTLGDKSEGVIRVQLLTVRGSTPDNIQHIVNSLALLLYILDGHALSRFRYDSWRARRALRAEYQVTYGLHPQTRSKPNARGAEKARSEEDVYGIDID